MAVDSSASVPPGFQMTHGCFQAFGLLQLFLTNPFRLSVTQQPLDFAVFKRSWTFTVYGRQLAHTVDECGTQQLAPTKVEHVPGGEIRRKQRWCAVSRSGWMSGGKVL